MGYRLTPPLIPLGHGELVGVRLGDDSTGGTLSCALACTLLDHSSWHIHITGYQETFPAIVLYDEPNALRQPIRPYGLGRQARDALAAVVPFLLADAESYRRTMGANPPTDGWIFNAAVAEWSYLNDAELQELARILAGQP